MNFPFQNIKTPLKNCYVKRERAYRVSRLCDAYIMGKILLVELWY